MDSWTNCVIILKIKHPSIEHLVPSATISSVPLPLKTTGLIYWQNRLKFPELQKLFLMEQKWHSKHELVPNGRNTSSCFHYRLSSGTPYYTSLYCAVHRTVFLWKTTHAYQNPGKRTSVLGKLIHLTACSLPLILFVGTINNYWIMVFYYTYNI